MNKNNIESKKQNVAATSVLAGFTLTAGKFAVGLMTGSMGILSEAAHSLLDMGAAIITYFAVRVSDKPADEDHHYGHGKIEAISALIETALLFITSFWIIYEANKRLMTGDIEVEATWYAFAVVITSIIIDYTRSRARHESRIRYGETNF
jgi:cation diffusion facilitator family transporter